jgi:hypothetical protein
MNHSLIKLSIVAGVLIAGLLLYAFFVPSPTIAAQCTNYDATVASIEAQGHKPFFIAPARLPKVVMDAEAITGDTYGVATRGFLIVTEVTTILGLEVAGCLLNPIYIANPKPDGSA